MRAPLPLLLVSLLVAGCLQPGAGVEPAATDLPIVAPRLSAHTAAGPVALPAETATLAVRLLDTGFQSGEPTIGVTSDGAMYVTSGGPRIGRSTDGGQTWQDISDPVLGPKTSLDPWIWVDPWTDRVYDAPLYVACTWAAWTDDGGASWDANPVAGCGVPAHDHQKLTSGPPAEGVIVDGYANVVYYSYNSFRGEGTWVSASYDGGRSYGAGQAVHPPSQRSSGVAGPVIVAADGTAYSMKPADGGLAIATTRDSAQTWEAPVLVDGAGIYDALATTVDGAADLAGNAYGVYNGADGLMYLTRSVDAGKSWSGPVRVSPPQVTMTVFAVAAAGDAGQVVVGYLGTTSDVGDADVAEEVGDDVVWHAWLSYTDDATADDPVWTTVQVTPDDDPVQIGCIWLSGGSNPCRNLGDFIDLTQRDGRAYLVYPDGCAKCTAAAASRDDRVIVAVVDQGPSLLGGALAPFAPETAAAETAPTSWLDRAVRALLG